MKIEAFTIRLARADEFSRLQEIEQSAALIFGATKYASVIELEPINLEVLAAQQEQNLLWVAADLEDQPVGFALVKIIDGCAHLHELDVDPSHARQGIGARLVRTVYDWAKQQGYAGVTLSTFRDIAWNGPFYQKLGFRELNEDELSEGLLELRRKEKAAGLAIEDRICMLLTL